MRVVDESFDDATIIMDALLVICGNTEHIIELLEESEEDDGEDDA
jgi:hypothetical protein